MDAKSVQGLDPGLVGVSTDWELLTLADADLTKEARYLWILTEGDVKVTRLDGVAQVLPGVPAGSYLMGAVKRVWLTGTHASAKIVAFYR